MPRVQPSDVQQIYPTSRDCWPFILTAHRLIDTYLATSGQSEEALTDIERWWTAALMEGAQPGGLVTRTKMGGTDITYDRSQNWYWAQVLMLDQSGILSGIGLKATKMWVF